MDSYVVMVNDKNKIATFSALEMGFVMLILNAECFLKNVHVEIKCNIIIRIMLPRETREFFCTVLYVSPAVICNNLETISLIFLLF